MLQLVNLFEYETFHSISELTEEEQMLFKQAENQLNIAYAPYSNFHVGAAVLLNNHEIVAGSNQENASYPLCMCAERVALYSCSSQFPEATPVKIAVVATNRFQKISRPIPPCGACRQVILEYEHRFKSPIEILLKDDTGIYYKFKSARDLLPLAFDGSFLTRHQE